MEIKRPLLLISNDDGYQSKGIRELVEMVSDFGDIIVCAPRFSPQWFLVCLLCHHAVEAYPSAEARGRGGMVVQRHAYRLRQDGAGRTLSP